jgi:cytochrome c oxidase assembly factor CtaG
MAMTVAAGPTSAALAADWTFRPLVVVPLVLVAALYLWGVIRVARRHPARRWPLIRAGSFLAGLGVIAVATLSAIETCGTTFFWIHMAQHLLLIMVAPALVIHGRPLILALHATRNPWHTRIKRLLRSRVVTVVTHPLVAFTLYTVVVVGTHLTSFNNVAVTHRWAAAGEQVAYLVSGYLYLLSGFGEEPIRWRLSHPAKMLVLVLSMSVDTFTGITLLMAGSNPWPAYAAQHHTWGPDLLTDVHYGGAVMWVGGDTIMICLILTALVPWVAGRNRNSLRMRWVENARRASMDRYAAYLPAGATARRDVDEDEQRLDAYNAWLAAMAERDRGRAHDRS